MSRIDPEQNRPVSPAKRFFEWSGKDAELTYYDKENLRPDVPQIELEIKNLETSLSTTPAVAQQAVKDIIVHLKKKKDSHNIPVATPFTFIVLDRFITIGGFNKAEQIGYYSNEIKKADLKTSIFQVRSKNGLEAEGTYEQIKAKLTAAKFIEVVYVGFLENKVLTIGAIKMVGSSLTKWFNYVNGEFKDKKRISNANDPYKGAIVLDKGEEEINGDKRYFPPTFTYREVKPEMELKAIELTKVLVDYHTAYFEYMKKETSEVVSASAAVEETATSSVTETPVEDVIQTTTTAATTATTVQPEPSAKEVVMEKSAENAAKLAAGAAENDLPWE